MREILFRGKRKSDGEWIFGNLLQTDDDGICIIQNHVPHHLLKNYEVYPETVGQYIGLDDKVRKIFDGDIVSAPFTGYAGKTEERKGVVEFVNGAFSVNWNDSEEYGKNFVGYVNDIEVIGNIFDNPELIGE